MSNEPPKPTRIVTGRFGSFSPEEEKRQLEETLAYWREAGPTAIWDATFEMLDYWFTVRGLDPEQQRVDRTKVTLGTEATRRSER
jgi:hypothetical protein